jgi:hypothetical protein
MEMNAEFKSRFIKNLQGKDFILYGGLIALAQDAGFQGIRTTLVQAPSDANGNMAIVHATVTNKEGFTFDGLGDCDDRNANKMIVQHKVRMAETRAKGRALRDMLGIDMVCFEELGDDGPIADHKPQQRASRPTLAPAPQRTVQTDDPGAWVFPAGKYTGQTVESVAASDPRYISFCASEKMKREDIKAACRAYLDRPDDLTLDGAEDRLAQMGR